MRLAFGDLASTRSSASSLNYTTRSRLQRPTLHYQVECKQFEIHYQVEAAESAACPYWSHVT